jgi:hypothetical protein
MDKMYHHSATEKEMMSSLGKWMAGGHPVK